MPRQLDIVGPRWRRLAGPGVEVLAVQMRPERHSVGGRLYLAAGAEIEEPPADAGFWLDADETSGVAGFDLATLDPGGDGSCLWARYEGWGQCIVWCSWKERPT